ncbi:MAG: hypothetical protein J5705_05935 [Bacteroidaceae bacterium]|nr:hypothetical protein [Bacteroidaceae bacterium]
MKNLCKNSIVRQVALDGFITMSNLENGLRTADFQCCEDVNMNPFSARCKVQAMRDGNIYITELPKRRRNKALFREDNSSLTLGNDGRYYFSFSLTAGDVNKLPQELVRQASSIAHKVMMDMIGNY